VAVVFPSLDAELHTAIADKRLIELRYEGAVRIAEPHDYGVQNGVTMQRNAALHGAALRLFLRDCPQIGRS
jgi:hypothetical protein